MSDLGRALWDRAVTALRSVRVLINHGDTDSAASRAYYAAFYAVSAFFVLQGKTFSRHTALETAVHRDLVHAGRWSPDLGEDYSSLVRLRTVGDYGRLDHVSIEHAEGALAAARRILEAVRRELPADFPDLPAPQDGWKTIN